MTDDRTLRAARYAVRVYPEIVRVQATVADYFGITRAELFKPCRRRSIARPRQIAMWIVRQSGRYSLPEIGRAFGGRDHTTILHGVRLVNAMMQADAEFAGLVLRAWAHCVDTNQPQAVESKNPGTVYSSTGAYSLVDRPASRTLQGACPPYVAQSTAGRNGGVAPCSCVPSPPLGPMP